MATPLPMATLGRTGLQVTRLGYGTSPRRPLADEEADKLFNSILDAGINLIDTSDDYGNSEELIGKFISHRTSEYYLATKCGAAETGGHLWTRDNVFRNLHQSLRRLKSDSVDVMQLHNAPVEECERGDLVEALQEMRQQGKVRWIGVSTILPHLPTYLQWGVFDVFQIPYSALERDHEGWITKAAEAGVGILTRGESHRANLVSGLETMTDGASSSRPESTNCVSKTKAEQPFCCASPKPIRTLTPS